MRYDRRWDYRLPADTNEYLAQVPAACVDEVKTILRRVASDCADERIAFENLKARFREAAGQEYYPSSNSYFAGVDFGDAVDALKSHPPAFIKAAAESLDYLDTELQGRSLGYADLNDILAKHSVGYVIVGDEIVFRSAAPPVAVPEISLVTGANEELTRALEKSAEALSQGDTRRAVQDVFWVLESLMTAFEGVNVDGMPVTGKYFNEILKSLKKADPQGLRALVLRLTEQLHSFISNPSQGGVRHGKRLEAAPLELHEAALICDVVRSVTRYIVREYERLKMPAR